MKRKIHCAFNTPIIHVSCPFCKRMDKNKFKQGINGRYSSDNPCEHYRSHNERNHEIIFEKE